MNEHAKGRLKSIGNDLRQETGRFRMASNVTACGAGGNMIQNVHASVANARRLAAAWNVCEGIDTEELEIGATLSDICARSNGYVIELNAARALLREVAAHPCVTAKLGAKLKSYFDECDTLEGK